VRAGGDNAMEVGAKWAIVVPKTEISQHLPIYCVSQNLMLGGFKYGNSLLVERFLPTSPFMYAKLDPISYNHP
jgi:hypothetical protein